jgi:hypothetical protein
MTASNPMPQTSAAAASWPMPIAAQTYPDRRPHLTSEEKQLMEQYATAMAGFMTAGRARNVLKRLARFDIPFLDTVRLAPHTDTAVAAGRRHLFRYMAQTELAFWAWPQAIWIAVIEAAPGRTHASGTRFWMLLLAYLFCDVLYIGTSTVYWPMAETIFGRTLAEAEVSKVRSQLVAAGYAGEPQSLRRDLFCSIDCIGA